MNQSFNSQNTPIIDPKKRLENMARHKELASGTLELPNLMLRSTMTVFLLYALLTLVLITAVETGYLDANFALIIGIVLAIVQFTIGPWLMDLSLSWMYNLNWAEVRDLPDHLVEFVNRVCDEHKMRFPRFGVIEDGAPQAFTYGHHPNNARIIISRGTIDLLLPEELEGVVAHEIGHARNWDMALMTIVNFVPLALYWLYRFLARRGDNRKSDLWYVRIGAYLIYIISEYVVLWFSRTREFYADRFSGRVTGNPNALASALIKIAYGLAAQDSKAANEPVPDENEMITLNLSGNKPWYATEQDKKKSKRRKRRETAGEGALAALNIFDRKTAVSMVMSSAGHFTDTRGSGLNLEQVKNAMQWDLWNPWAKWFELHSTHPVIARRLEYLADQAAAMGQQPMFVFDRQKGESYLDEFAVDLLVMALPMICLAAAIGLFVSPFFTGGEWRWQWIGIALTVLGAASLVKTLFQYRNGDFKHTSVADLLGEVKVSPVRPLTATLTGRIIGKGVPGLVYSEDFVLRDSTGIIFLDYQQPLAIWNFLFGLLRASEYQGRQVRVQGWFRRAPIPYLEIYQMELIDEAGESAKTCYTYYANLAWDVLVMIAGIVISLYLF